MKTDDLTGFGIIVGIIVWIAAIFLVAIKAQSSCPSVFLTSIVAVGMLAPAWAATHMASSLKPKK